MRGIHGFLGAIATSILASGTVIPAFAQVTSDNTTNTNVNTIGNDSTILNGIERGNNLFHSFSNFSVPTNGSASFDLRNTPNITTIFSRVTGGNVSDINGLIQTLNGNSPASLFLINPAGIVFGENASLNIGGSFVGTTAESVVFGDGFEFSAVNAQNQPLLTVSVPVGLQMGINPGDITINNTGHQLVGDTGLPLTNQDTSIVGLQVTSGNTLALVGGNLTLDGGIITAPSGKVELSAIGNQTSPSRVGLQIEDSQWQLTYNTLSLAGNIQFLQQALVNASGTGQGTVQIRAGNLTMEDGSIVWLENRGNQAAGSIDLYIAQTIDLIGAAPNTTLASGIYGDVGSTGTGKGSDVTVNARQISFQEGGNIQSRTFGFGDSGRVTVNASSIELLDIQSDRNIGILGTRSSRGTGNAGDLTINTQRLNINSGGAITGSSFGSGNSGNIVINAGESVKLTAFSSNPSDVIIGASGISAVANAGNITINTSRLSLNGGALISSSTFGAGRGGIITVNASETINLSGSRFSTNRGTLEGSSIRTAGVLLPDSIRPFLALPDQVTGPGGDIIINTPKLEITDLAEIAVRHDSVGNAGNLQINSESVILKNQGQITANTASGEGGNINLNLKSALILENNSVINTEAQGTGNGGNITINSPVIAGLENSDIIANAIDGNGGNINITTQGIFGLQFRDSLTPESDITASSEFGVSGTVDINNFGIDPNSGLAELSVKLADASEKIATACADTSGSSFIATGRGGIPQNPNQQVNTNRTWSDIRNLSTYRQNQPVAAKVPKTPETLVQATSWRRNSDGKIELVADNSSAQVQTSLACTGIAQS